MYEARNEFIIGMMWQSMNAVRTAVVDGVFKLTYQQLHDRVVGLSEFLRMKNISVGNPRHNHGVLTVVNPL